MATRTMLLTVFALSMAGPVAAQTEEAPNPHARSGFWFVGGLGYGSLGCQECDVREGGFSGGLALGGTISQKVLLGGATTIWTKSENGVTLSVGTALAMIRFYPSNTGGFFLTGGLGVGSVDLDISGIVSASETAFGALLGLGYDIRVARNLSLTPYLNSFALSSDALNANVGQVGLAISVH